ncbi:SMC5-SMC6 complex localization factor protein 1 isoform X3 [Mustelus asterias]
MDWASFATLCSFLRSWTEQERYQAVIQPEIMLSLVHLQKLMAGLVQNPIIQLTGFKHSEKGALVKLLTQLNCTYFLAPEYKQQCTHMIASKPSRSEKFLAACAAGNWVLTKDYIIDSAKNGSWLTEIQYEWGYKIPSNSQYPIPMESVPKIWREELAHSGIPGVFHNWKVVLLINDEARRATFKRVLHAGKAAVYHRPRSCREITHVLTENRNYTMEKLKNVYKAPYFPVEYIGQFILEPLCSKRTDEDVKISYMNILDVAHISSSSFLDSTLGVTQILPPNTVYFQEMKSQKSSTFASDIQSDAFKCRLQMCLSLPEAIRSNYVPSGIGCCLYTSTMKHHPIKAMIFTGVTINRIEGILEGQFYMEALKEIRFHLSSKFFPPAHLLQSLLQLTLEGNVDLSVLHEFISIMQTVVLHHPPWQQFTFVSYYMGILQCSNCKKGSVSLFESLARSCVYDDEPCHQPSNQELSISELKPFYKLLLKFFFELFEAELQALNKSCYENTNYGCSRTIPPSVLAKLFLEYSDVMTNPVGVLLDCVLQATRTLVKKPFDISSYLIALGRLGSCRKVVVKDPKGKKMGQWPWPEPLRPSLNLIGDRQRHVEALTILAEQNVPLMAKMNSSLESKETKTGSSKINLNGAALLQHQDYLGKTPLDYIDRPKVKEDLCAVAEVQSEEITEGQFGNLNKDINPTEIEPSAYLWSMLLKNYIENHNLPLICHVVNDSSLTIQVLDKNRFENLVNSFPDQLMVQYAEDLKAYKELPKYIQQVFDNLRSRSLILGAHTQLVLLHVESVLINS